MERKKITPIEDPRLAVSRTRRETGAVSLAAFVKTYLPEHFKLGAAPMHNDLMLALERFRGERSLRMAVAAPRNHAKSTVVTLAFALWCLAYELESFIVLVSDTADQAQDHLSNIKRELESNERLREDFPWLCPRPPAPRSPAPARAPGSRATSLGAGGGASGGGAVKWKKNDLVTGPTPKRSQGMRVLALGAEQQIRGRRSRSSRPSLIICDDLENNVLVRSAEQRQKRIDWFFGTLMKAGSVETNTVVVGTVLHHDALLARLLDPSRPSGWIQKLYKAVERWADRGDLWDTWESIFNLQAEWQGASGPNASTAYFEAHKAEMLLGVQVLWPEQMSYRTLMEMRTRDSRGAFATEMQNEPMSPDAMLFREEDFHYWDDPKRGLPQDPAALLAHLKRDGYVEVLIAVDPALGRAGGRGDYTAIIVLAKVSRTKQMYVLAADIARHRPDQMLDAIVAAARLWDASSIGVETVCFQELLINQLKDRMRQQGRYFRIRELKQTQEKNVRIGSIHPLVTSGLLQFSRRHTTLMEQLKQFPGAAHDDGPDALEMAVRMAQRPEAMMVRAYGVP